MNKKVGQILKDVGTGAALGAGVGAVNRALRDRLLKKKVPLKPLPMMPKIQPIKKITPKRKTTLV